MKKIFTILTIILLAVSCEENVETTGRFEVNGLQDSYVFAADLGQKIFFDIISDNVLWEISLEPSDQDWMTVTPMRSLGGYETVTLAPDENNSAEARSCTLTLTSENGYSKSISVTQRGI